MPRLYLPYDEHTMPIRCPNTVSVRYECSTKFILLKTNGKCADQAGWKKAQSGQYLCCSHATTPFLLMTKILCVAGRTVPLDD